MMDALLKTLSKTPRFPHGIIFTGHEMPSLEKSVETILLAQECLSFEEKRPCHACANCLKVQKKLHTDVFLVQSHQKEIVLETIKEGMHWLMVPPSEMNFRYLIILEAEWLSRSSSNALLKLLEEPPVHGRIFFVTANHHELLQTIRSRTFNIRIPAPSSSEVAPQTDSLPPLVENALGLFQSSPPRDLPPWFDILEELGQSKESMALFFKHLFIKMRLLGHPSESFLELILQTENSILNHYGNVTLHLHNLFFNWRQT